MATLFVHYLGISINEKLPISIIWYQSRFEFCQILNWPLKVAISIKFFLFFLKVTKFRRICSHWFLRRQIFWHTFRNLGKWSLFHETWACWTVWPDWAIYWTLGNFSKPVATISLPKSPTGNFVKVSKSLIFLEKSFLGNFYRQLAIFYWSHWCWTQMGWADPEESNSKYSFNYIAT